MEVLRVPFLTVHTVSMDVKQHWRERKREREKKRRKKKKKKKKKELQTAVDTRPVHYVIVSRKDVFVV